jgi:hypothetical protein
MQPHSESREVDSSILAAGAVRTDQNIEIKPGRGS